MAIVDHAGAPSSEAEFARRAAYAWIRAADAGVIDADELIWLLDHLSSGTTVSKPRMSVSGSAR